MYTDKQWTNSFFQNVIIFDITSAESHKKGQMVGSSLFEIHFFPQATFVHMC